MHAAELYRSPHHLSENAPPADKRKPPISWCKIKQLNGDCFVKTNNLVYKFLDRALELPANEGRSPTDLADSMSAHNLQDGRFHPFIPSIKSIERLLPGFARSFRSNMAPPTCRSTIDDDLVENPSLKLERYVYLLGAWTTLAQAEGIFALLGASRSSASSRGVRASLEVALDALREQIEVLRASGDPNARIFILPYVGIGGSGQRPIDGKPRPLMHALCKTSLNGLYQEVFRAYQRQDSTFFPFLTFLASYKSFAYSKRLFMHAETIASIMVGSASILGGGNVCGCGAEAFAAVGQVIDKSPSDMLLSDFITSSPASIGLMIYDVVLLRQHLFQQACNLRKRRNPAARLEILSSMVTVADLKSYRKELTGAREDIRVAKYIEKERKNSGGAPDSRDGPDVSISVSRREYNAWEKREEGLRRNKEEANGVHSLHQEAIVGKDVDLSARFLKDIRDDQDLDARPQDHANARFSAEQQWVDLDPEDLDIDWDEFIDATEEDQRPDDNRSGPLAILQ